MDEPASFGPKAPSPEGRKTRTSAETPAKPEVRPGGGFVAFTIEQDTGRVIAVETVDAAGARQALTDRERTDLAGAAGETTLEDIIEQAFEAGVDCVLGGAADEEAAAEADDDTELQRALLRSLIDRSAAKRLMQREVLSRAVLRTLIAQAFEPGATSH